MTAPTPGGGDLFAGDPGATLFPPTLAAARNRLSAVRPADYARSRNHLDGAVTRLSPYISHGFIGLPEVLRTVHARHPLDPQHKFVYELGWRAYFHHVWAHHDDGIFESLHEGLLPDTAYACELPADIAGGRTGLPVIDAAVRELHATGWLHNHARMWLASYVVHLRKVHWRTAADWLYGHLLDGDLASNHLSWQWVAGTGSSKPYLFNAENVARYAPPHWHSAGTLIDTDYGMLERLARSSRPVPRQRSAADGTLDHPAMAPPLLAAPPAGLFDAIDVLQAVQGRTVQLLHPWVLGEAARPGALRLGIALSEFHAAWPWSERRWRFVATRLREACDLVWHGDAATLQTVLGHAQAVHMTADPHLAPWLGELGGTPAPALFPPVNRPCRSFSQYWQQVTRGISRVEDWWP